MVLLYGQESFFQSPAFFGGQRGLAAVVDVPLGEKQVTSLDRQVTSQSFRRTPDSVEISGGRQNQASLVRGGAENNTYNANGAVQESLLDQVKIKGEGGGFYQTDAVNKTKTVATVGFDVTKRSLAGDTQEVRDAVALYEKYKDQDQFAEFRYGLDEETGLDIKFKVTAQGIEIPGGKTIGFDEKSILKAIEDGLLDIPTSLDIKITEVEGYQYIDEATGEVKVQEGFTLFTINGSENFVVADSDVSEYRDIAEIEAKNDVEEAFSILNEVEKIEEQESAILTFTYKDPIDYIKIYREQQELNNESRILATI